MNKVATLAEAAALVHSGQTLALGGMTRAWSYEPETFEALLRGEWAAALHKGNVPLYAVYEVTLGGNMGEYYTFTPLANFAALDGGHPVQRALGPAQYNLLLAKVGALVSQVERSVTKLDEDLSYGTPPR